MVLPFGPFHLIACIKPKLPRRIIVTDIPHHPAHRFISRKIPRSISLENIAQQPPEIPAAPHDKKDR
jgi:hypothetical protein